VLRFAVRCAAKASVTPRMVWPRLPRMASISLGFSSGVRNEGPVDLELCTLALICRLDLLRSALAAVYDNFVCDLCQRISGKRLRSEQSPWDVGQSGPDSTEEASMRFELQ